MHWLEAIGRADKSEIAAEFEKEPFNLDGKEDWASCDAKVDRGFVVGECVSTEGRGMSACGRVSPSSSSLLSSRTSIKLTRSLSRSVSLLATARKARCLSASFLLFPFYC